MIATEPYTAIPAAWLALGAAWLYVTNPKHRRTRAVLAALVLPLYGLAVRLGKR